MLSLLDMATSTDISNRIIEAVMAQKLAPGARLGEQQLAMLFDCSRTKCIRSRKKHLRPLFRKLGADLADAASTLMTASTDSPEDP